MVNGRSGGVLRVEHAKHPHKPSFSRRFPKNQLFGIMAEEILIQAAILAPTLAVRVGLRTLLGVNQSIRIIAETAEPGSLENVWLDLDVVILQDQESLEGLHSLLRASESPPGILWISDDLQAVHALRALPLTAWGLLSLLSGSSTFFW